MRRRKSYGIIFAGLSCFLLLACSRCPEVAVVVLGTRPLDSRTPSLDMLRRVEKARELYRRYPDARFIFTGGKTAGEVSEARMMAQYALSLGIPAGAMLLEENARSTEENARYTAGRLYPCRPRMTFLVTRQGHLNRAVGIFSKYPVFGKLQPAASRISKQELMQNLQEYLATHRSRPVQELLSKAAQE